MPGKKPYRGKATTADDGIGLPGVTVLVEGTSDDTATDLDGNYTINVSKSGASLVYSFIGYTVQTIAVGTQTEINVTLQINVVRLSDVIVKALGIPKENRRLFCSKSIRKIFSNYS